MKLKSKSNLSRVIGGRKSGINGISYINSGEPTPPPSGTNEIQHISVGPTPSSGSFTITFDGYTTIGLSYIESAAAVESALENLMSIGSNNVSVTGDIEAGYDIEFINALGSTNVNLLTVDSSALFCSASGGDVTNNQTGIDDIPGEYEVQVLTLTGSPNMGTFLIKWSTTIAYNANASTVETAVETVTGQGVSVTGSDGGPWTITWSDYGDKDLLTVDPSNLSQSAGGISVNVDVPGDESTQAVQTVTLTDNPTAGTFSLNASTLSYNETAAGIENAVEFYYGPVSVSGGNGGPWTVTWDNPGFQSTLSFSNIDLRISASGYSVVENTQGATPISGQPSIQGISLTNSPTGGTFTINGISVAYNANNAAIETAVENATAQNVTSSGSDGGPWTITWNDNGTRSDLVINTDNLTKNPVVEVTVTQEGSPA